MADNVIHLSNVKNDSRLITPEDLLYEVIDALKTKEITAQKLLVLYVADNGSTGHFCSNMSAADILGLLARQMHIVNKDLD